MLFFFSFYFLGGLSFMPNEFKEMPFFFFFLSFVSSLGFIPVLLITVGGFLSNLMASHVTSFHFNVTQFHRFGVSFFCFSHSFPVSLQDLPAFHGTCKSSPQPLDPLIFFLSLPPLSLLNLLDILRIVKFALSIDCVSLNI